MEAMVTLFVAFSTLVLLPLYDWSIDQLRKKYKLGFIERFYVSYSDEKALEKSANTLKYIVACSSGVFLIQAAFFLTASIFLKNLDQQVIFQITEVLKNAGIFAIVCGVYLLVELFNNINHKLKNVNISSDLPSTLNIIGWFIIPVANLIGPYRIIKKFSRIKNSTPSLSSLVEAKIATWWVSFVGSYVGLRLIQELSLEGERLYLSLSVTYSLIAISGIMFVFILNDIMSQFWDEYKKGSKIENDVISAHELEKAV